MPIRQLPQSLVNRIAAGEVIERPASVVKELVENAIDAGASRIQVDVEEGGLSLIRITDDGSGIPPEELPLALAAHATSKLTTDADLEAIATFGFRGEALASIGSVSHTRLTSRTPTSDAGASIETRGESLSPVTAAPANIGTTIEVRNLFFNTPARRKFMKTPATEFSHIADTLLRLALPHPSIHFSLTHNGRASATYAPTKDLRSRLLAAWPDDYHTRYLPIDLHETGLSLTGIVGLPELALPAAKHQYLYINGRSIRDRFIQHALKEAFRGLTEPGRHPPAVLLISLAPGEVDVNVHPTKAEVRFRDSSRIYGQVHSVVRETLLGSNLTPKAHPRPSYSQPQPSLQLTSPPPEQPRLPLQQQLANFFRSPPTTEISNPKSEISPPPSEISTLNSQVQSPAPIPHRQPATDNWQPPPTPTLAPPHQSTDHGPQTTDSPSPQSTIGNRQSAIENLPSLQLHNTYLVVESPEGLLIIDQHALHERILFEDLLARASRGPLESQRLLIPLTFPASARQQAIAEELAPILQPVGIELSTFGPGTLAIHSFPSLLHRLDPVNFARDLLAKAESDPTPPTREELLHTVLDMMSCKAAVKAGDPLTPDEISALLAQRHLITRSSNCPHGRPTTLSLSLKDLEKQFKRTGF